jgi:hypothetical protein
VSSYRELTEVIRSGGTEGDWVDFPASPEPDPWAALLREANRLPPEISRERQVAAHQIAFFARGRGHRRAQAEQVTAKNR